MLTLATPSDLKNLPTLSCWIEVYLGGRAMTVDSMVEALRTPKLSAEDVLKALDGRQNRIVVQETCAGVIVGRASDDMYNRFVIEVEEAPQLIPRRDTGGLGRVQQKSLRPTLRGVWGNRLLDPKAQYTHAVLAFEPRFSLGGDPGGLAERMETPTTIEQILASLKAAAESLIG